MVPRVLPHRGRRALGCTHCRLDFLHARLHDGVSAAIFVARPLNAVAGIMSGRPLVHGIIQRILLEPTYRSDAGIVLLRIESRLADEQLDRLVACAVDAQGRSTSRTTVWCGRIAPGGNALFCPTSGEGYPNGTSDAAPPWPTTRCPV